MIYCNNYSATEFTWELDLVYNEDDQSNLQWYNLITAANESSPIGNDCTPLTTRRALDRTALYPTGKWHNVNRQLVVHYYPDSGI